MLKHIKTTIYCAYMPSIGSSYIILVDRWGKIDKIFIIYKTAQLVLQWGNTFWHHSPLHSLAVCPWEISLFLYCSYILGSMVNKETEINKQ